MTTTNHQTFPYNPFRHVSDARIRTLLFEGRNLMIAAYTGTKFRSFEPDRTLTFDDFGDIAWLINGSSQFGMNTDEKCVCWNGMQTQLATMGYDVAWGGLREKFRDTYKFGQPTGTKWGHIVVNFNDPIHGTVGDQGDSESYTDGTREEAEAEIRAYESRFRGVRVPTNHADVEASLATVDCMFALRTHGFQGFADTWNRLFLERVRTNGMQAA